MSDQAGFAELLAEIKQTRENLAKADEERLKLIGELQGDIKKHGDATADTDSKVVKMVADMTALATKCQGLEESLNDLRKRALRPGKEQEFSDEANRKAAVGLLQLKHDLKIVKKDADHPFSPSEGEITEAGIAVKALSALVNSTNLDSLSIEYRKALSAFQFGSNGFILSPIMSDRILSCLVDPTDVTGIMANMTIAGPSVRFLIDNVRIDYAAWACETACFANNPQPNLTEGLGELEIKPETLRYIVCTTRDILEDASIDIQAWMLNKVNQAYRRTISTAIMTGDGVGKPIGILNPNAGIPICETSSHTAPDTFTWQDLVSLKWQVPMQYHSGGGGGRYLLNQNTFGQILTMSDAASRPILVAYPQELPGTPGFLLNGSPIQIVTQMPDVAPGATPVAFGNWPEVYMIVNRKAVTMQQDPYSAGFCILFKFESRIGGGIICPNAARLLRIK